MIHDAHHFACRIDVYSSFHSEIFLLYIVVVECEEDLVESMHVSGFSLSESLNLVCFMLCVYVMGVKHHSPLGGKRCLGEGVSWAHACS